MTEHRKKRAALVSAALLALAALGAVVWLRPFPFSGAGTDRAETDGEPTALRYDTEYPAVGYSTRRPDNRVTRLAMRLDAGELELEPGDARGFLDALLDALEIDTDSQLLVFSKTSLQVRQIGPTRPRAIYFNDDTYVAFSQGAPTLEIATMDPALGPMFFTLSQNAAAGLERRDARCLRCHDSLSLTGGGVPRFIVGSGYFGADGRSISHEGRIITTQATPLRYRWGGWYVTGFHGEQVHLGNIVVRDPAALHDLESLRIGNRPDLDGLVDASPYPAEHSDIVAQLVFQHQTDVQNTIARARFDAVTAADTLAADALQARLAEIAEPLVRTLFSVGAAELGDAVRGTSGFAERFAARGPADGRGRSLRELDLETRLFRYPLSYLIYSAGFDGLPETLKAIVYARIRAVLDGPSADGDYAHLNASRAAIREILRDTKPEVLADD